MNKNDRLAICTGVLLAFSVGMLLMPVMNVAAWDHTISRDNYRVEWIWPWGWVNVSKFRMTQQWNVNGAETEVTGTSSSSSGSTVYQPGYTWIGLSNSTTEPYYDNWCKVSAYEGEFHLIFAGYYYEYLSFEYYADGYSWDCEWWQTSPTQNHPPP